jgi:transcriptional regulator with XRE-family HTH domain
MISPIDKYVADQVKERRTAKGMSQSELAFELSLPTSFIGMIESGKYDKKYNVTHLNAIARVLECSPKDFLPAEPI